MDDMSDVIALTATGTYTVTRRPTTVYSAGRVVPLDSLTAWVGATVYVVGDQRRNGANAYEVITAGTSAGSGGPTGTAADITDNTVHWKYLGAIATTFSATGCVQPLSGRELDRLPEGLREREPMAFWTTSELRGALGSNDPDSLVVDGDTYQVQTVLRWATLGNYYKAIVAKVGSR